MVALRFNERDELEVSSIDYHSSVPSKVDTFFVANRYPTQTQMHTLDLAYVCSLVLGIYYQHMNHLKKYVVAFAGVAIQSSS